MNDSDAFMVEYDRKVTFFDCHQRFLPMSHAFRGDKWSFLKGNTIRKGPLKRKLEPYIMKMLDDLKESENGGFKGYSEHHNWTRKSYLYELPYAKVLILLHNINLMHKERNITESIISMCFDVTNFSKDYMNVRKDLATLCNYPSLEAKRNAKGNLTRPQAPYCLKPVERKEILKWLMRLT
jgi:hypothetical protein